MQKNQEKFIIIAILPVVRHFEIQEHYCEIHTNKISSKNKKGSHFDESLFLSKQGTAEMAALMRFYFTI